MQIQGQKGAFTLAEMIIVVGIVAVLGTISFLMFSSYSTNARDTVRSTDLNTITKFLTLNKVNKGRHPVATDPVAITYSGVTLWSQGVFGKDTQVDLGKHMGELKDPAYGNHYTYAVTNNGQEYQIGALFEKGQPDSSGDIFSLNYSPNFLGTAYASDPFLPLELSPAIWLDATDVDGDGDTNDNPSNGGTSLAAWVNKSTAGALNNPSFTNGNLGYHSTGFDGAYPGVFIRNGEGAILTNSDITQGDIFYVVQNEDPFNSTDTNGLGLQSSVANYYAIGYWGSRRDALRIANAPKHHNSSPATTNSRTAPYIYSFHTDNVNYSFRDTGNLISQGATTSVTGHVWAFNRGGVNTSKADWIVSEILIFNTELSQGDREKIEGYLAHKWGQEGKLSGSHPYKSAPPEGGVPPTPDTIPDPFSFSDVSDADISTEYISNSITVSGINTDTSIEVTNGEYNINGGAFTASGGTVSIDDIIRVKQTSAPSGSITTNTVLTIGGGSGENDSFDVTTRLIDETPDSFNFASLNDADLNTEYTSNSITISGINSTTDISISGVGVEYKISNGVPYDVTGAGTASSSENYSGSNSSDAFDNSNSGIGWGNNDTLPATLTYDLGAGQAKLVSQYTLYRSSSPWGWNSRSPKNWTFEGSNNGSTWSVLDTRTNELVGPGQSKRTFNVSSPGVYQYYRMNISANNYNYHEYVNITEMELIDIGGAGNYSSNTGTVNNGDVVTIKAISSINPGTTTTASLTVGTYSADYDITTVPADTTPDTFSFSDVEDASLSSTQTSTSITVVGINQPASISVSGASGTYSINGGAFTSSVGTVDANDSVRVRLTASSSNSTTRTTTLTIGGVSANFNVTTPAPPPDTTPDSFSFSDVTNATLSTEYVSNVITITGINTATTVSISGGEYSINDLGSFTSSTGSVNSGDTIAVRNTSSASVGTSVNTILTVGTENDTFSTTTIPPDTTPDAFLIDDISDADIYLDYDSNSITVSGINTAVLAEITSGDGQIRINGGAAALNGMVNNGDTIVVEMSAAASWSTPKNTVLEINGVSDVFTVTTGPGDTTPDAFLFNDVVEVNLDTEYISDSITITGINAPTPISVNGGEYRIDSGPFTSAAGIIHNNQTVNIRARSANSSEQSTSVDLDVGGVIDSFDLTTYNFAASSSVPETLPSSNMYVKGDYNGLFVHGESAGTHYVVAAPSLITADPNISDINNIIDNKLFVYDNFSNIPASYAGNELTMTGGFDFTINTPLLYEGSKEDLGSYGGLQQIDALVRSNYSQFPAYYNVADKLDTYGLSYVEEILSSSVGINPIKPYYCNDIKNSKLLFNIAPQATVTASATAYNSYGTGGIVNGVKSSEGDLDYEYHSASGNANITFEWDIIQKVGFVKIFNRTGCCSDRLSGAIIRLYDAGDNLVYSHSLWDTTDDYVVDLDLEGIGQLHYVKKMTIDTVGGNFMNIREVEIYTGGEVVDGVYKVDRDGAGGQSPYNVYCDMTTDGGGRTRIGENYVTNGQFVEQRPIDQYTFQSNGVGVNVVISQSGEGIPPSYVPEAHVLRHNGSVSEYYQLEFKDVPGAYFAQEIRLSIWQKGTTSSLFAYEIDYKDGSSDSGVASEETLESDGAWKKYSTRISLDAEVEDFRWNIADGVAGTIYFTDPTMEIYYR